ncbi:MAG: class I SAM-dependent methyltransferase [Candidatus Promineifilaceae bacterium]|nr:class I SAM-dependent methyltransferase [Candidatus Promineifilaceae bacterium]
MNHEDHVALLAPGVPGSGGTWADIGSGRGAFTLALAELVGSTAVICSVDKDGAALRQQTQRLAQRYPEVAIQPNIADFRQPLDLPPLDGLVMANALHFIPRDEQARVVRHLRGYLRPGGRFLLVEYDTDRGNRWVPHPLSYVSWARLAQRCGFEHTERLATVPSSFLGRFFSAASW